MFVSSLTLSNDFNVCCKKNNNAALLKKDIVSKPIFQQNVKTNSILVGKNITVGNYFQYIDSLVIKYDSITPYKLTEHLLVRSNPWIIDTLQNTDYYRMIVKDSFVYDQKKMIVLPKGALIFIPDSMKAEKLLKSFNHTLIDINIPEFKLRIYEDSTQLYEFPVRVGRNEKKYLAMAGRTMDLRTKTGKGTIVSHVKTPDYYNPVDGKRYYTTRRDDQKVTRLPQIPFLEPEINGMRHGQLIHPTTNPVTLGKAYSNGCIGTKEADAWVIYYYAPIGTKIHIRYDLQVTDSVKHTTLLKDIYGYSKKDKTLIINN
ncbi:L,D-transpeptidase [Confluentibacter lentus]|uniref:L,D-transpeptidase n=1 Tax=Confluentibacter lentus TaxID=1699412 RepID=UPI000C28EBB5|nr:L,D-transpeptidase [Confluentibacter lentus]